MAVIEVEASLAKARVAVVADTDEAASASKEESEERFKERALDGELDVARLRSTGIDESGGRSVSKASEDGSRGPIWRSEPRRAVASEAQMSR